MIELILILSVGFLLTGIVLGHWMVYGGPNLNIFPVKKIAARLRKPRGRALRQIKAGTIQPHNLPAKSVPVKRSLK